MLEEAGLGTSLWGSGCPSSEVSSISMPPCYCKILQIAYRTLLPFTIAIIETFSTETSLEIPQNSTQKEYNGSKIRCLHLLKEPGSILLIQISKKWFLLKMVCRTSFTPFSISFQRILRPAKSKLAIPLRRSISHHLGKTCITLSS